MRAVPALLLAALVACGTAPGVPNAGGIVPLPALSGTSAAPDQHPVGDASTRAAIAAHRATASPVISASPSTGILEGAGYGARNNMPFAVIMSATCARPGDQMRVDVVTLAGAQVGFAAAYSDNNVVPDIFWVRGEANPTGSVTWTWVIKPTTPPGDAWLEVVAAKKPNKGATYEGRFRVAASC